MADLWLFCRGFSAAGLCEDSVVGRADGRCAKPQAWDVGTHGYKKPCTNGLDCPSVPIWLLLMFCHVTLWTTYARFPVGV